MRIVMDYGLESVDFEVADKNLIADPRPPTALADPTAAVRAALEQPYEFPPLRRALTPDDRVAIVVDERLPHLTELLVPVLEHLQGASVSPEAMTLLCPPSSSRQTWIDELPDAFQDVRVEMHDPDDRRHLAYLATTRHGKRIYLNRTLVDADQIVVLAGRRYDLLLGYSGAEGALYPAFCDKETRDEMNQRVNLGVPNETPWPVRREAMETAWLLGAPFFVQVIEGSGDRVAHVIAGTADASREGQSLLNASWRRNVPHAADLVVASVSGDPTRQDFATLAAALACAARVVEPGGRIVLLSQVNPALGTEIDVLRNADDPQTVLESFRGKHAVEMAPALQWASAANHAKINLLSGLPEETVEELFATPLNEARQVQRLLDAGGTCLFLQDAHKMLAVVE
jgi:nickel-dependent lactate racemase